MSTDRDTVKLHELPPPTDYHWRLEPKRSRWLRIVAWELVIPVAVAVAAIFATLHVMVP